MLGIFVFLLLAGSSFPSVRSCFPNFILSEMIQSEIHLGPYGCTESQVYYEETRKCYALRGSSGSDQSPCGLNMLLERTVDNGNIGRCDCENLDRPLFYNEKTKQCYFIFSQGPCKMGQWIELINGSPKCVTHPCFDGSTSIQSQGQGQVKDTNVQGVVLFNGNCTQLRSPCKIPGSARSGQLLFTKGKSDPECKVQGINPFALGAIASTRCPYNTYRTLDGRGCQAPIYFDFD